MNKLVKFVLFKKVLVRMFFITKYVSVENVFIFQLFLHITLFFYNHNVFFLGQTQYAYDFPKLSLKLRLQNMLQFLRTFKKYVFFDGGDRGYSRNVRKRTRVGGLPRVYVSLYFFKGVFSHLSCLFLFFTSLMRK